MCIVRTLFVFIGLALGGCQWVSKANNNTKNVLNDDETNSTGLSVSLISNVAGGIYVFDIAQRKATQIKEIEDGELIKYSFKNGAQTSTYDFIYTPDGGPEAGKMKKFVFDSLSLTTSAPSSIDLGQNSKFNGPSYCTRQGKIAFVTLGADRTTVSTLDLGHMGTTKKIFDKPLFLAADLSCENISNGVVYSSFSCISDVLNDCLSNDNTMTAIYHAVADTPPVQLTFPSLDQNTVQSPGRPILYHLGDVDSRAIETEHGNFLVFQRIYTTNGLFNNGAPNSSEYAKSGFHGSYYKEVGSFSSPKKKEFQLNYDSWVLNKYDENLQNGVEIDSIMFTPDIKIASEDSDKIDIVISASIKSHHQSDDPTFNFDGLLQGRFDRSSGTVSDEIEVKRIKPILEMREFACAMWDATDIIDEDGSIYLYTMQFSRFIEREDLISFSSVKGLMISKDRIKEIDGVKYLTINGQPMPVDQWRSLYCSGY